MRIVHMDSGLGNQMLDYAEYLAIQKMNPDEPCYLETIIYEIPDDVPGMISQWNGYELDRIFGINPPNIKELFDETAWRRIVDKVKKSEFWNDNWNNAPFITQAINDEGYHITNLRGDTAEAKHPPVTIRKRLRKLLTRFFQTRLGYHIKRISRKLLVSQIMKKENGQYDVFRRYPGDVFIGHSLNFRFRGFGIEKIDQEIREAFRFPDITDEKNQQILEKIQNCNSISIHARRGDLIFVNWYCYHYGFFKRAVKYIKKHVENPEFFFFTDEDSVQWCKDNPKVFGLEFKKDKVHFVDWNKGLDSYRDMQLMSQCKHNISTESSFGFWGSYLNQNPNKITCAPDPMIMATHSF